MTACEYCAAPAKRRFCSLTCVRQSRRKDLPDVFWRTVNKTQSGCWEWAGVIAWHGYGHLRVNGKLTRAHRHAWRLTHGDIPAGVNVCHRCDNPKCINPEHLFLGTDQDNVTDKVRKGRWSNGRGPAVHGSLTYYTRYKCRCDACRQAKADNRRKLVA